MKNTRRIAVVAALLGAINFALPSVGNALPPIPIPSLFPSPSPTPTTQQPGGTPSPTQSPGGDDGEAGKGDHATEDGKTPPFRISSPKNTAGLVSILSQLTRLGIPLKRALISGMGRLPVAGLAYWSDDWHAPRCCPEAHLHQGLDIFAPKNAPALAVAVGRVTRIVNGPVSGKAVYLTDAHGTYYFYGHLNGYAKDLQVGQEVRVGELIGYVGNTGNALGTPAHIHFEIHPGGGSAVPPKPYLDRWLAAALKDARAMIARRADELAMAERVEFRLRRSFDLAGEGGMLDASAQRFLFLTGLQPAVSSLEMARQTLGQMAWEIDWADLADAELAQLARQVDALQTEAGALAVSPWGPFGPSLLQSEQVYGAPAGD
jgi:murein DD-endopeptidase MepM/ murein hydrolase activator NlpD